MKKSLNNRFKGKRLVTGDEGELTQHEILLKEEENGVVVKERGTNGEVKQISAGGDSNTGFNLLYYAVASIDIGNTGNTCYPYKMLKNTDFTELANIRKTIEEASDYFVEKGIVSSAPYINVEASFPSSSSIDYYIEGTNIHHFTVKDENDNMMHIEGNKHGEFGVKETEGTITIKKSNNGILGMSGFFNDGLYAMSSNFVTNVKVKKGNTPFYFAIQNIGAYYDIRNNILYYVTASTYSVDGNVRKWNIYPESLVDTLKVYGGHSENSCTITVNGKIFKPESF